MRSRHLNQFRGVRKMVKRKVIELPSVRYVVAGKRIYRLSRDSNGLWRDHHGVIWALQDTHASVDENQGCGVSPFVLPDWHIFKTLNDACSRHDYMYSSPAFQYFHTRKDADEYLEMLLEQDKYLAWLGRPFKWVCRIFGGRFWDRKESR